jgi:nucleotide-binding universal stress UspA family protein
VTAVGDPASSIAQLAEDRDADLVVVGTRGVGPIQRLLGQSVSQAVSRRVSCDLLIVHPGRGDAED